MGETADWYRRWLAKELCAVSKVKVRKRSGEYAEGLRGAPVGTEKTSRTRAPSALIAQVVRRTAEGLGVEWCCEQAPDTVRGLGETASLRESAAEDSNKSYSSALALLQRPGR